MKKKKTIKLTMKELSNIRKDEGKKMLRFVIDSIEYYSERCCCGNVAELKNNFELLLASVK